MDLGGGSWERFPMSSRPDPSVATLTQDDTLGRRTPIITTRTVISRFVGPLGPWRAWNDMVGPATAVSGRDSDRCQRQRSATGISGTVRNSGRGVEIDPDAASEPDPAPDPDPDGIPARMQKCARGRRLYLYRRLHSYSISFTQRKPVSA